MIVFEEHESPTAAVLIHEKNASTFWNYVSTAIPYLMHETKPIRDGFHEF
jgi:hypothetical protein